MNFVELVENVGEITKRPERSAQIQRAISKATLKFHLKDFWLRDVVEVKDVWSEITNLRYMIDTEALLPGLRKISYLNGYDDVTDPANPRVMQEFTENSPNQIRDIYGNIKTNVFYLAGKLITCRPGLWVPPKFLCGYWKLPKVTASDYQSWIAEYYPNALIDEACAEVFGSIGDTDESNRRMKMFEGNLQIVRTNDITATGG